MDPSIPAPTALTTKGPDRLVAIELNDLKVLASNGSLKCGAAKHALDLIVRDGNQLQMSCPCPDKSVSLPFLARFQRRFCFVDHDILIMSFDNVRWIATAVKQACGYVPWMTISNEAVQFSCGHHKNCPTLCVSSTGMLVLKPEGTKFF